MSSGKATKVIRMTAQAVGHHTSIKIKNILRLIKSGHECRITVSGTEDRRQAMEDIIDQIQREVKGGADFHQKVVKPTSIFILARPNKKSSEIDITNATKSEDFELNEDDDLFSDDFERKLEESIKKDRKRDN